MLPELFICRYRTQHDNLRSIVGKITVYTSTNRNQLSSSQDVPCVRTSSHLIISLVNAVFCPLSHTVLENYTSDVYAVKKTHEKAEESTQRRSLFLSKFSCEFEKTLKRSLSEGGMYCLLYLIVKFSHSFYSADNKESVTKKSAFAPLALNPLKQE